MCVREKSFKLSFWGRNTFQSFLQKKSFKSRLLDTKVFLSRVFKEKYFPVTFFREKFFESRLLRENLPFTFVRGNKSYE